MRAAERVAERRFLRFKPIPDEEGTETRAAVLKFATAWFSFKPIPDEEGTETHQVSLRMPPVARPGFKPIPDEEGTETS